MNYKEYIVKVYEDGDTEWYNKEGQLHRLNGPAEERSGSDGLKAYYINGKLHNLEGPAVIFSNGEVDYYIEDEPYNKKDWEKEVQKIKAPCTGTIIEKNGIKYKLVPAD